MIPLSTATPIRWTPPWRESEADPPVYLLRAGSVMERAQFEAELSGEHRAGRVFPFQILEQFKKGLEVILPDEEARAHVLDFAAAEDAGEDIGIVGRQIVEEARENLAQHWPPYRSMLGQVERRQQIGSLIAFRRFCVGWEGVDVPFAVGPDRMITEAALAELNPAEMQVAGNVAYALLYGRGQAGNSEQGFASDKDPTTSKSDATLPAAGKSTAKRGKKTLS